jgi:hypothetical protein
VAEESGDLRGIGPQHPQALNALIGNAEMALSGATPLASPDTTEACVRSVSSGRMPSGHIPLILRGFVRGFLATPPRRPVPQLFETRLRYPSASPASPHKGSSFVPKIPPPPLPFPGCVNFPFGCGKGPGE